MLPLSMPVSNSATALPSTSRAGTAKFDLGAEHASKHITIYECPSSVTVKMPGTTRETYDYGKHF